MKSLTLTGRTGRSRIVLGGALEALDSFLDAPRKVYVTDTTVRRHWGRLMRGGPVFEVGIGEQHKTLTAVERLYDELLAHEVDRATVVVAVGGGMVGDVAGFAAATYLRGLRLVLVPSTLLAQVDASVGGKNGVNLRGYKNLIGAFRQPELVLCDFSLLGTLPPLAVRCGLAEAVKAAAIADADLFGFFEERVAELLALAPEALERAVGGAVAIKAAIVEADELEQGERRKLNFGHTFGHAIERATGLAHGEAVSLGMVLACDLSVARGLLPEAEAARIERLLERLGLPTRRALDPEAIADALGKDKKRDGAVVHAVLLERIGRAVVTPLKLADLREVLR